MNKEFNRLLEAQREFSKAKEEIIKLREEGNLSLEKLNKLEGIMESRENEINTLQAVIGIDPSKRYSPHTPLEGGIEGARESLVNYMKTGYDSRALTSGITGGSDSGGHYLVPQEWENQILEKQRELFVMRQIADVQLSENDRNIPITDDYGESKWINEAEPYPESDAKFSEKKLHAYKVGRTCKVSEELLMDNAYNLEQWLINVFAHTNGLAMETAYIHGDGVDKPRGFLNDAETVRAKGSLLIYDDLFEMFAELKQGYYTGAVWLMNRRTLITIMKMKDDAGNYIYAPFTPKDSAGTAPIGHILGKPVILSELMPDIGAGKKPIAFGDFKRYRIHDRAGYQIQRLNELYAETGFIGFRGMQRTDGKLLIPEAIKVLEF